MVERVFCSECQQLKRDYEIALQVWARVVTLLRALPLIPQARISRLVFETTVDRDLAAKLLTSHVEKCQGYVPAASDWHETFDLATLQDSVRLIGQKLLDLSGADKRLVRSAPDR